MKQDRICRRALLLNIQNSRGMALLLTLAVITLVVVTAISIHRRVRESRILPKAIGNRMTMIHMASSGVYAAMAVLAQDKTDSTIDSIQEDWADSGFLKKVADTIPFEAGEVALAIGDELGKLQINALVRQPEGQRFNDAQKRVWDTLLSYFKDQLKDESLDFQPEAILNAIKDWMDTGEGDAITGISGAESDYYQGLSPSYSCKNGPMTHLGELAFIRGIHPELFAALGGVAGLSRYLTVYGVSPASGTAPEFRGRININTADLPVLAALLPIGEQGLAQAIYDFRVHRTKNTFLHDLSDSNWYRQAPGCSHLRIDADLITVESDIFRIEAAAVVGNAKLTVVAVVKREKNEKTGRWTCNVLSWQIQ